MDNSNLLTDDQKLYINGLVTDTIEPGFWDDFEWETDDQMCAGHELLIKLVKHMNLPEITDED